MKLRTLALATALALGTTSVSAASQQEIDLLKQQLQALQKRLAQLEAKSAQQAQAIEANTQAAEVTAQAVEATAVAVESQAESGKTKQVHIAGYGEVHYNNLNGSGGASDKDQIDFHRFVLEFGYDFTDDIRFYSEVELEHSLAGDGKPGEVELEQAYIDFDINDTLTARGGLFLIPVGLLNETHEPPFFYGVERNSVEKNIIPTTWWEAGAGVYGQFGEGFSYDAYVHSGLKTNAGKNYAIRSGRQKVAEADANDLAYTARLKYTGLPGLELAATLNYQENITQSADQTADSAWLFETHAAYTSGPFGFRALYAQWNLDGAGPESVGADEQSGWYLEPSYRLNEEFGVFARYSNWDNQAGDSSILSEKGQWDLGFNYWPHKHVVIKADYQVQDNDNGKDQDGVNLGIGYQF